MVTYFLKNYINQELYFLDFLFFFREPPEFALDFALEFVYNFTPEFSEILVVCIEFFNFCIPNLI